MLLVTGASGFLGSAVVRAARARGLAVRAMVRASSPLDLLEDLPEECLVRADMTDPESLRRAVEGVRAVVHCAATTSVDAPDMARSRRVNVEGTRALLHACREAGVRRFVNVSSQSAHEDNPSVYGRTKLEQDREVMAAEDLDWTILRPSIIYGAQTKGIFHKMLGYCRKLPVVPVIGSGREEMRPIHVDDVARAALDCVETPATIGNVYDLGGADVFEYNDFIGEIQRALGRKPRRAHLPVAVALPMARMMSAVMSNPPLTPDNVTGIATVRHVDISAARRDFGFAPRGFREGLRQILAKRPAPASPVVEDPDLDPHAPPLRVAVLGLGKMGVMHASMCSAVPGVTVAALMDRDQGLGGQVRSMGVDAPFYDSLGALLDAAGDLDAAVVATPQFTHREIAVALLEKGLHVLCEKPLAHSLEDAEAMAAAAAAHPDRVAAAAFMKGHSPLWLEAVRRLRAGWIGAPRRFQATMRLSQVLGPMKGWTFTKERAGGGVLINSGVHLLHFLHLLFGDLSRVRALGRPMHSGVEDTLCALMEFGEVFGSLDVSWSVPGYATEGTTVLVEGDGGTMEIGDDWIRTHALAAGGEAPKGWSRTHRGDLPGAPFNMSPDYNGEGYCLQIADFARAVRTASAPRYDWRCALRVQRMVDAVYRSMEAGGEALAPQPPSAPR